MGVLKNALILATATIFALIFLYFAFILTLVILITGAILYICMRLRVMFGQKPISSTHVFESSPPLYSFKKKPKEKIIIIEHEENGE